MDRLGELDRTFIEALPSSVKYIAHTGAGYDTLDFTAAKDKGLLILPNVLKCCSINSLSRCYIFKHARRSR